MLEPDFIVMIGLLTMFGIVAIILRTLRTKLFYI